LGFHSEAEGYKYFPGKIRWRMNQLRGLLDKELPALQGELAGGKDVFAAYAGRTPDGPCVHSLFCADIGRRLSDRRADLPEGLAWQTCAQPAAASPAIRWTCCHDREAFYLVFDCQELEPAKVEAARMLLTVEPRRMWPCLNFNVSVSGKGQENGSRQWEFQTQARADKNGWCGWMRIPFVSLGHDPRDLKPLRINVRHAVAGGQERAWVARKPWPGRLLISNDNPADLGWLFFDGDTRIK
jgi:hypothetical protein